MLVVPMLCYLSILCFRASPPVKLVVCILFGGDNCIDFIDGLVCSVDHVGYSHQQLIVEDLVFKCYFWLLFFIIIYIIILVIVSLIDFITPRLSSYLPFCLFFQFHSIIRNYFVDSPH